jgi:hypothetical protein
VARAGSERCHKNDKNKNRRESQSPRGFQNEGTANGRKFGGVEFMRTDCHKRSQMKKEERRQTALVKIWGIKG